MADADPLSALPSRAEEIETFLRSRPKWRRALIDIYLQARKEGYSHSELDPKLRTAYAKAAFLNSELGEGVAKETLPEKAARLGRGVVGVGKQVATSLGRAGRQVAEITPAGPLSRILTGTPPIEALAGAGARALGLAAGALEAPQGLVEKFPPQYRGTPLSQRVRPLVAGKYEQPFEEGLAPGREVIAPLLQFLALKKAGGQFAKIPVVGKPLAPLLAPTSRIGVAARGVGLGAGTAALQEPALLSPRTQVPVAPGTTLSGPEVLAIAGIGGGIMEGILGKPEVRPRLPLQGRPPGVRPIPPTSGQRVARQTVTPPPAQAKPAPTPTTMDEIFVGARQAVGKEIPEVNLPEVRVAAQRPVAAPQKAPGAVQVPEVAPEPLPPVAEVPGAVKAPVSLEAQIRTFVERGAPDTEIRTAFPEATPEQITRAKAVPAQAAVRESVPTVEDVQTRSTAYLNRVKSLVRTNTEHEAIVSEMTSQFPEVPEQNLRALIGEEVRTVRSEISAQQIRLDESITGTSAEALKAKIIADVIAAKWKKSTVQAVKTGEGGGGTEAVEAWISDNVSNLAVGRPIPFAGKPQGGYLVYHVPTGAHLGPSFTKLADAKAAALRMSRWGDWSFTEPQGWRKNFPPGLAEGTSRLRTNPYGPIAIEELTKPTAIVTPRARGGPLQRKGGLGQAGAIRIGAIARRFRAAPSVSGAVEAQTAIGRTIKAVTGAVESPLELAADIVDMVPSYQEYATGRLQNTAAPAKRVVLAWRDQILKAGEPGEELIRLWDEAQDLHTATTGYYATWGQRLKASLSDPELDLAFDVLTGRRTSGEPKIAAAAKQMQTAFGEPYEMVNSLLRERGQPEIPYRENYGPQRFNRTAINSPGAARRYAPGIKAAGYADTLPEARNFFKEVIFRIANDIDFDVKANAAAQRWAAKMVRDGKFQTEGQAISALDFIVKGRDRIASFEHPRIFEDLPAEMYLRGRHIVQLMTDYAHGAANRAADLKYFGKMVSRRETLPTGEIVESERYVPDGAVIDLLGEAAKRRSDLPFRDNYRYFKVLKHGLPRTGTQRFAGLVMDFETAKTLTYSGLMNVNDAARFLITNNTKSAIKSSVDLLNRGKWEESQAAGVGIRESLALAKVAYGRGPLTRFVFRANGFFKLSQIGSFLSARGKYHSAIESLGRLQRNGSDRLALKVFKEAGVSADAALRRGHLTDAELARFMRAGARVEQFTDPTAIPAAWQSTTTGQLMSLWSKWMYQSTRFMVREILGEATKGNIKPLARALVAYGLAGEVTQDLVAFFRGRRRTQNLVRRIVEDYATTEMLALAEDIFGGLDSIERTYGNVVGPVIGGLVETVHEGWNALSRFSALDEDTRNRKNQQFERWKRRLLTRQNPLPFDDYMARWKHPYSSEEGISPAEDVKGVIASIAPPAGRLLEERFDLPPTVPNVPEFRRRWENLNLDEKLTEFQPLADEEKIRLLFSLRPADAYRLLEGWQEADPDAASAFAAKLAQDDKNNRRLYNLYQAGQELTEAETAVEGLAR